MTKEMNTRQWVTGKLLRKSQAFVTRVTAITYVGREAVYDTTQADHNTVIFNGLVTGQCGEQPLPSYGCCCLGSINLTPFVRDASGRPRASISRRSAKSCARPCACSTTCSTRPSGRCRSRRRRRARSGGSGSASPGWATRSSCWGSATIPRTRAAWPRAWPRPCATKPTPRRWSWRRRRARFRSSMRSAISPPRVSRRACPTGSGRRSAGTASATATFSRSPRPARSRSPSPTTPRTA